jgi:hypothetical protein
MKAKIEVKGQISGNRVLRNVIEYCASECKVEDIRFNNYEIHFDTMGAARKALATAYRNMRQDGYDVEKIGNYCIKYDASSATIYDHIVK